MRFSVPRRMTAVAWALGAVLLLPAGARAGFTAPITVTASGADPFGYPSDVGFDQAGTATVETVSGGQVLVYTRPSGGSFSGGQIGRGTKASMAVSANGNAVTAWRESATSVRVDYRSASGGAFAPAASYTGSAVGNVAVGIDTSGNAVVAWKDGGIHFALSTGTTFGAAQDAPLGAGPGFEGRGSDPQRDRGPRAFRDNAGNVLLAYRDGNAATVAHRGATGAWDSAVLPGGASSDLNADADPASQRLIVGYTTTAEFRAFEGSTSSSTGTVVLDQPASTANIISVAVRRGGIEDLALWRDNTDALRSASCLDGYTPARVAASVGAGVIGVVTSGSDQLAYYVGGPGLERASRPPGGAWTDDPYAVSNFGTFAAGAGYNGDALGLFVDFPSDTAITGFPYGATATSSATCAAASPNPTPAPSPQPPSPPTLRTGTPKVLGSSSAQLTATINPQGLPTTVHFEYALARAGARVAPIAYDARTPDQPVGADFADHVVTATVGGLLANSTYHLRAVAANRSGVAPGADTTFRTRSDPPPPAPVLAKSVNAVPVSGTVSVLLPGKGHVAEALRSAAKGVGFIPLTEARQLPVGTIFDTTGGVVRLTSATAARGKTQSGDFGAGLFKVLQNRRERGLTELALVVQSSAGRTCAKAGRAQAAARRALPRTVLTLLHASVKGRYRTRGRFSSATVRGTVWTTTDRCDGTLTAVKRGVVVVSDFRRKRQIVVRAGRSYLATAR